AVLVHTGQHYDYEMSKLFFDVLELESPDYNLGVGSGPHGWQTGEMLKRTEEVLVKEEPDIVIVYGDTNSTLAGTLAAVKLHIPVAHVEAGLRSFNNIMPEEINRMITDRLSTYLFCPSPTAVENLAREGITEGVHNVGDVMYDALLHSIRVAEAKSNILDRLGLKPRSYLLATVHRAENTDEPDNLGSILKALGQTGRTVILPLHPRTRRRLEEFGLIDLLKGSSDVMVIDPVSYLDMLLLEKNADKILTDSGGMQKEAYWLGVPCITLRTETEWPETVEAGWNVLVGAEEDRILEAVKGPFTTKYSQKSDLYGDGDASGRIIDIISHRGKDMR
ncbi:MAG TPA: UDP-N-acetylglucosamine 2-epimerase (non-hydrolyzing), partial [Candidatus Latescibacteria bacterium]|nr:UDP-N-acetylglucosamine 2-epimerase (non-hydrolyzing) [Candidatus Latescibacterota bacterium]